MDPLPLTSQEKVVCGHQKHIMRISYKVLMVFRVQMQFYLFN